MDYVVFPFEKFVSCITTEYDVQADSILALYIEIAKYLRDNPIVSGLTVKEIIDRYLEENPPSAGVVSVNGKTGAVTGLYDAENPPPYPVKSVNGKTGAVTGLYDAENPPPYPVKSVNGKTGAVTGLYDAENPPPYPVTSVNGKRGDVIIQEGGGTSGVTSVNGKTGVVTGLYDEENPPPYPVNTVFGLTGNIRYPLINIDTFPKQLDGYENSFVSLSFVNPSSFTLPDGNTATFKVKFDSSFVCPIGVSRLGAGYNTQLSVNRDQNGDIIVTVTNHSGTGEGVTIGGYYLLTVFLSGAKIIHGIE